MSTETHLKHIENSLTILRRVAGALHERSIGGNTYSRTQLDILTLLDEHAAKTTKDLVDQLVITSGAITQTVETLVRRGLILKERDASDHRFVQLKLSDKGQTVVVKYLQLRHQLLQVLTAELSEPEIDVMLRVAEKMKTFVTNDMNNEPAVGSTQTRRQQRAA